MDSDEQEIRRLMEEWRRRTAEGDVEGVLALMSDDVKELHASGDLAYAWTYVSVAVTSTETGSKSERAGHAPTVFRKSPSGTWVLTRDANLIAARP